MIICRTPYRISFFGGGTDFPGWFKANGGAVLSTSIDKYCYISVRHLPPFFEHKHRITYSRIELVQRPDEIRHPVVRALLKEFGIDKGLEIHHDGDVPAHSGLGTSSSFTVGMLNSLFALTGKIVSKSDLAARAIQIEQDVLKENVGSQDQVAVAFGALNRIVFHGDGNFSVQRMTLPRGRIRELESHLLLVYTGVARFSSDIAAQQIGNIPNRSSELNAMRGLVDQAVDILNSGEDIRSFGRLLNDAWELKKKLSDRISNETIDAVYATAMRAGALGGKVLGAGGGGFVLFFVPPDRRAQVEDALRGYLEVAFRFETHGSQIIHYDHSQ